MSKELFSELLGFFAFTHDWNITASSENSFTIQDPMTGLDYVYHYEKEKTIYTQETFGNDMPLCVVKHEKPYLKYFCFTIHENEFIATIITYNPERVQIVCSKRVINCPNWYAWESVKPGTVQFQVVQKIENAFITVMKNTRDFRLLDVTGELTILCI